MSLQDRLNELKPFVSGIRFVDDFSVVDVNLKEGWVIPKSEVILYSTDVQLPNYYIFYSEDNKITVDDLLDFVGEVIIVNLEKEQKKEYYKIKLEELKTIFRSNSLNDLYNLKFTFSDSEIIDLETPIIIEQPLVVDEVIELPNQDINHNDIEEFNKQMNEINLPNKVENGRLIIEVEGFNIKTIGNCNHGSDTFCNNCMENI